MADLRAGGPVNMTPAIIRAQAATMIRFLDLRLRSGHLSAEEHVISVGEIERWANKAIANIIGKQS